MQAQRRQSIAGTGITFFCVVLVLRAAGLAQGIGPGNLPPPVERSSEEDHRAMLELLGIKQLRPGANPNDPNAPNAVNYEEAKANPYPCLPDPLLTQDRRKVTTAEMWWSERRDEIVELFDREIYGRVPENVPDLGTDEFPPIETALIDGEIAFRQHGGGHTAGPNWPTFLDWAERYIRPLRSSQGAGND